MIPSSASLEAHEEAMRLEDAQFKEQKRIEQWLENRLSAGSTGNGSRRQSHKLADAGSTPAPATNFNGGAADPLSAGCTAQQASSVGFGEDGR